MALEVVVVVVLAGDGGVCAVVGDSGATWVDATDWDGGGLCCALDCDT